jgi:type IV secretory pathway VirB10-like protein
MDSNELPDKNIETPPEPETGSNPLDTKKVPVARFNRRRIMIGACAIFLLTAFSFMLALSPKKKLSAHEIAEDSAKNTQTETDTKPSLPENAASMPAKYGEGRKVVVAGTSAPRNDPERDSLEKTGLAGERTDDPAGSQENPTTAQQTVQSRTDQRQKDSISATRAPVSFGGGNTGFNSAAPVKVAALAGPDVNGSMNKVIDRLSAGPGPAGPAEPEDQNLQGEKRRFTKENRNDFPYTKTTLITPISPYEVKAGTILPGVLLTGINSDLPGQILAQARESVYDTVSGRYLLIPLGSRFIGEYDSKISYGQERILVVWTRIIMPNGNSIGLENMPGIDLSGYAGVSGRVNNHYGKLITGVVLGSVIGAGAQVAVGGQGAPNVPPSFEQLFVAGAASNINQAGQRITEKNLNLQPTIEVAPGAKINIFVTKDMILKPYTD